MHRIGFAADLEADGQLTGKVDHIPVVVFWSDGEAFAIEDRCPHLGFPLHRGTVESGMVTCHWHHARFDLSSGCTFDPWADDAMAFDVTIDGDAVYVSPRGPRTVDHALARLRNGLEDDLTLVIAKAVVDLLDAGVDPRLIVRVGAEFGARYRDSGWGAGMTVLTALGSVLDELDPGDRALALTQALAFLAGDVRGHAPRFALDAMDGTGAPAERLAHWYRRFIDGRSADAAERTLATALRHGSADVEAMLFAAATDHVFIDEGHTLDFTNKAVELVALLDGDDDENDLAQLVLPTLVAQTANATRHEELSEWRHPDDLAALIVDTDLVTGSGDDTRDVAALAEQLLEEDPRAVVDQLIAAGKEGASAEQLARAVAHASLLRILRFHTQNDHRDWNIVHHGFTTAHALHQAVVRNPTFEVQRGIVHMALKVYLDRFLNVPPARPPRAEAGSLDGLAGCFEVQGRVDDAGAQAYGFLVGGGAPAELIAALGHGLLVEDAGFHWFQLFEACVRHHHAWPQGSEPSRLTLAAFARFLSAHTPTRRERSRVVEIARRLRRNEELFVVSE